MRKPPWVLFVALAAGAWLGGLTCGIREDELLCEEAVGHLADCCAGFEVERIECRYVTTCGGQTSPAISDEESRCIRAMTCPELKRRVDGISICERAQNAISRVGIDEGVPFPSSVCP